MNNGNIWQRANSGEPLANDCSENIKGEKELERCEGYRY